MSGTKMSLTPELVALTLKPVPDEGPEPRWNPIQEDELDALVRRVTEESNNEPLWIFAYGSLIWNPDFDFDMKEVGTVYGWHRSFSLHIERWRATSEQPGLMLALERGGTCKGIAFRMQQPPKPDDLRRLLAREIRYREVTPMIEWVDVHTKDGKRKALPFWASSPSHQFTTPLSLDCAVTIREHF
ncbi:gamma-glutamylcyclotransferase [Agrobacterium pusense]|uniref:gamma-glutamylcyclotransferase n=1 Tax=Agrobacterium pusense TaxID=648995 RepID=UPI001D9AFB0A|nr:gamma-glutamylcyclotransferase [Agrobacterium pusense]MBP2614221.1 cation transport protein ChaC [Agrobacterium pusense]